MPCASPRWEAPRTATDARGHTTEYFYDGNPWRNVDSVRVVTPTERQRASSTYDAYGRTSTVTDPLGRTATFTYDDRDRLTKQRAPGDSVTYRYGTHGLTAVTAATINVDTQITIFYFDIRFFGFG